MKINQVKKYTVAEEPGESIDDDTIIEAFVGESVMTIHRTSENPRIYAVETMLQVEGEPEFPVPPETVTPIARPDETGPDSITETGEDSAKSLADPSDEPPSKTDKNAKKDKKDKK